MDNACDFAIKKAKSLNHQPIYVVQVSENSSTIWMRQSVLVVAQDTLDFYSLKNTKLYSSFYWLSISALSFDMDSTVEIKFGRKKFKIHSILFGKRVYSSISYVCTHILTKPQLKQLGIQELHIKSTTKTPVAIVSRAVQKSLINFKKVDDDFFNSLKDILITRNPIFFVNELANYHSNFDILCDIFPLLTHVEVFKVDAQVFERFKNRKGNIFDTITKHAEKFKNIYHFEIKGKRRHLRKFFEALTTAKSSIYGIKFENSELMSRHILKLVKFIDSVKLQTLVLRDALSPGVLPFVYENLFSSNVKESLTMIIFDTIQDLNLEVLVPHLKNIVSLGLINCNLLVEDVINSVNSKLDKLRVLDISLNSCKRLPPSAISLPQSLYELIGKGVVWGEGCLANLVRIIGNRGLTSIKIDLSEARVQYSDWQHIFSAFDTTMAYSLISFKWDYNPIDQKLCNFLMRNPVLSEVSFNGCLSSINNSVRDIANLLRNTHSIHKFYAIGSETNKIGSLFSIIADAILASHCVDTLIISNNNILDEGLSCIANLIRSKVLKELDFDGSNASVYSLSLVMDIADTHKGNIRVSFPFKDFQTLINHNSIQENEYKAIVNKFKISNNDSTKYSYFIDTPFEKPFYIYKNFNYKEPYITPQYADSLKKCGPPDISFRNYDDFNKSKTELCNDGASETFGKYDPGHKLANTGTSPFRKSRSDSGNNDSLNTLSFSDISLNDYKVRNEKLHKFDKNFGQRKEDLLSNYSPIFSKTAEQSSAANTSFSVVDYSPKPFGSDEDLFKEERRGRIKDYMPQSFASKPSSPLRPVFTRASKLSKKNDTKVRASSFKDLPDPGSLMDQESVKSTTTPPPKHSVRVRAIYGDDYNTPDAKSDRASTLLPTTLERQIKFREEQVYGYGAREIPLNTSMNHVINESSLGEISSFSIRGDKSGSDTHSSFLDTAIDIRHKQRSISLYPKASSEKYRSSLDDNHNFRNN